MNRLRERWSNLSTALKIGIGAVVGIGAILCCVIACAVLITITADQEAKIAEEGTREVEATAPESPTPESSAAPTVESTSTTEATTRPDPASTVEPTVEEPSATFTSTVTLTSTITPTASDTSTSTLTVTPTSTSTSTVTPTSTSTPTPITPTATFTITPERQPTGISLYRTYEMDTRESTTRVVFSPDGALLAAGDSNGSVYVYRFPSGNTQCEFTLVPRMGAGNTVNSITWAPDSTQIAVALSDERDPIFILNVETCSESQTIMLERHESGVLSWSPSGELLAYRWLSNLTLINAEDGSELSTSELPTRAWGVAWSPNSDYLAIGGYNSNTLTGEVLLWNVSTNSHIRTLTGYPEEISGVRQLAFSPDSRLLMGNAKGRVVVWNMNNYVAIHHLYPPCCSIDSISISPQGLMVATLSSRSADYTLSVFSLENGDLIFEEPVEYIRDISWSPDGSFLAMAGGIDEVVYIMQLEY